MADVCVQPNEVVFCTPELCALIMERAFHPEGRFTVRQFGESAPSVCFDVSTLASLASVNRTLSSVPWPAAAGMAQAALGHAAEERRWHCAPNHKGLSSAAVSLRATLKSKLEAGLDLLARSCDALDAELRSCSADAPAAALARTPGSAAERAYRACLLFSAVDAIWRPPRHGPTVLLPEVPPQLLHSLSALGLSARLPAELRAAALSALGAVIIRFARSVAEPHRRLLAEEDSASTVQALQERRKLEQVNSAGAEIIGVLRELHVTVQAIEIPVSDWWFGPLDLALMSVGADDMCTCVIQRGLEFEKSTPSELVSPLCTPIFQVISRAKLLCRLLAGQGAPDGARSCAAAALEKLARWIYTYQNTSLDILDTGRSLVTALDESGATAVYRALSAELDRALWGVAPRPRRRQGRRGRRMAPPSQSSFMLLSRFQLLEDACQLRNLVDDELRPLLEFVGRHWDA